VTLVWVSEESIVTAGHDCQPVLFSSSGDNQWKYIGSLDDASSGTRSTISGAGTPRGGASGIGRLNNEAFNRFKNADVRGSASPSSATTPQALQAQLTGSTGGGATGGTTELLTVHQNTINSVRPYEWGDNGEVARVSTTGVDGRLVVWNVDFAAAAANGASAGSLSARLGGLRLK
jgi:actin related protein 2/3 complex, subunit 1A/1B